MALIKCPECEKEMSSSALSCPHCGAPNKQEQANEENKKSNKLVATICAIVIFVLGVFGDNLGMPDWQRYIYMIVFLVVYIVTNKNAKGKK